VPKEKGNLKKKSRSNKSWIEKQHPNKKKKKTTVNILPI
jgi:hypothetical protein